MLRLGGTIDFDRVFCLTAGDLALLSIAFRITGASGPDGVPTDLTGTTCELVRRQPDGAWKYVIDHPFAGPART
ncbi:hypothetical protein O7626_39040 [Micromonospora sp. WMMD1102]|uniref:YybH family protein n=1 Tax=Micromonospora sp. WMMD1102 TaxID=3016105 RepID=UPI002414FEC8|nr:hypothetical protein [Micromonospora sp. WMMD1102]MDG4791814.1 hypothetical protein [Micromonospora sp. WMMD1102]